MSAWGFTSALLLVGSTIVSAAPPPEPLPTPLTEIVITSESLVFKDRDNTALFAGKVVMAKGDFVMRADQMVVYFDGTPPSPPTKKSEKAGPPSSPVVTDLPTFGNRAVSVIDATGNVVIQRGEKRAKSKKAVYHQRDDTLVLTGDPEAWEEGYRVTGTKMTMFLREDRSIVEGSRVVINDREPKPR
ncbi:MAG TPA: LptA/OstA family protein [Nitrospirales bacterium]|nr:LptA/OstA family protein [Nitrospirales bacterium]